MSRRDHSAFRKRPPSAGAIVTPLVLSLLMTLVGSAISTLRIRGPGRGFLGAWPVNWALSWIIAFPTLLVVLPLVRRLTAALVRAQP